MAASVTLALFVASVMPAHSDDLAQRTRLFQANVGNGLSAKIEDVSGGSLLLSSGRELTFDDWYSGGWRDLELVWLTAIDDDFGFFWGFTTGESGQKYDIDPSLRLGFVVEEALSETEAVTFSILTSVGGYLSERPCIADYGTFGSSVRVNCRLASTYMRPKQTLRHLFSEHPLGANQLNIRYQKRF